MDLVRELQDIARALAEAGIPYAVCGGVAVTIHGATRSTKDIDLLVEPADVPRVLDAIRPLGFAFAALPMVFDAGTERERHVQRVSKVEDGEHLVVDLLLAEAAFAGCLEGRLHLDLPEGPLSVVALPVLLRMKRLAARAQDLADIEKLESDGEA